MNALAMVLGGAGLVGIGIGIGAHLERARWRRAIASFHARREPNISPLRDAADPFRRQWIADPPARAAFQQGHKKPWVN